MPTMFQFHEGPPALLLDFGAFFWTHSNERVEKNSFENLFEVQGLKVTLMEARLQRVKGKYLGTSHMPVVLLSPNIPATCVMIYSSSKVVVATKNKADISCNVWKSEYNF